MFDIDHQFSKARELIDCFLDPNVFAPTHLFDVSEKTVSGYLYRGQARKDWPLLPSAHRSPDALHGYTPQPPHVSELERGRVRPYIASYLHAELRAVQLFLEAADRVGIHTPLDYSTMDRHQTILDDLFADRDADVNANFPHPSYLASMALAQHHGVPTRLLDWTESPLVAAYFAAEKASALAGDDREESDFSILCLGTQLLGKVKSIATVAVPRAANSFLRVQKGTFTLIQNANRFFIQNGRWPSIEDAAAERDPTINYAKPPLIRMSLPASEADELLRLLYRLDVSRLTLMPSLNHAAANLTYKRALWPPKPPKVVRGRRS